MAELISSARELESELGLLAESSMPSARIPVQLLDGTALGNYELIDQIHRGGSGQILKARHRHMDRLAAIKILSQTAAQSEELVARFRCKAKLLGRLNHPNLVATYDAGELDEIHYLIMEHVDGPDVVGLLKDQMLDVPTAVGYITQAAQALRYAHGENVIHRNINPSHLLVAGNGVVKVIGWSLALHAGSQSARGFERPGSPVGTLDYMAPEQIIDSCRIDGRADIYSLGCTLFTILAKRVVYPIDWQRRKATAQRYQPAPSLKEVREDVTDLLEEAYQRMMAKDPNDRFRTMDEVIEALGEATRQVD
jgi:serine/threonine protein kinase